MLTHKQRAAFSADWRSVIDDAESLGHRARLISFPSMPSLHDVLRFDTDENAITAVCFRGKWRLWLNSEKTLRHHETPYDAEAIAIIRGWLNEIEGYREVAA
ncbi:hypothetical protein [Tumebacillus flagellatus]|uniref:Uncharacterized protein n=1 Tax=Tumebacillus flagellatus TaxID=1157490 RepID=A0A074LXF4_9BACL|nr:hypothetical protein [Tumebacillus flagellatus]KEO84788.1 hypothetical protein EL26_01905 [Tumebacillus flagellatus]